MEKQFHYGNRQRLYETLSEGTLLLMFSGHPPRKTADENYPFYANRNFLYLTGIEKEGFILLAEKAEGTVKETMFILPPDAYAERWNGIRMKAEQVTARSGVSDVRVIGEFEAYLHGLLCGIRSRGSSFDCLALDLYKYEATDRDTESFEMAKRFKEDYPYIKITNLSLSLRRLRTIKQPCEIAAIREAVKITREGIMAMMKASKPGMYEYQYKAEFDYVLAQHGVLSPAFPSIISAGDNNFCIHYYEYMGKSKDGDMILNDVGAQYDNLFNDVSRGWPCNGKFSPRQRQLYTCAFNTSQHMFELIRPGMLMADVDRLAREYNFEQLKSTGLCDDSADPGRYIWHGGAHHVGWDTHDMVDVTVIEPGMVFCVDIGIYCEEWGIGFRLEDNCLVTENGCENLTASIPRTIEEIEEFMTKRD